MNIESDKIFFSHDGDEDDAPTPDNLARVKSSHLLENTCGDANRSRAGPHQVQNMHYKLMPVQPCDQFIELRDVILSSWEPRENDVGRYWCRWNRFHNGREGDPIRSIYYGAKFEAYSRRSRQILGRVRSSEYVYPMASSYLDIFLRIYWKGEIINFDLMGITVGSRHIVHRIF